MANETQIINSVGACSYDSEFRLDPLTGRWALISEGRSARPSNVDEAPRKADKSSYCCDVDPSCPFCLGSELRTPAVVALIAPKVVRANDVDYSLDDFETIDAPAAHTAELSERPWFVRVIENKYPIFRMNESDGVVTSLGEIERRYEQGLRPVSERFFNSKPTVGRHEVIVDSRRHTRGWGELSELEICLTFRMFRSRLQTFRDADKFAYSFVFKNVGGGAGASQLHTHCQLTGNVELPINVRVEIERLIEYERGRRARKENASFWDALLDAELTANERIVYASERFVVYCPYASRYPMQTEIWPRFDGAFETYDDSTLDELAILARKVALALEEAKRRKTPNEQNPLDYNVLLKNVPTRLDDDLKAGEGLSRPRWVFLPSLVKKAGYEIGSGIDINPVAPETVAQALRELF